MLGNTSRTLWAALLALALLVGAAAAESGVEASARIESGSDAALDDASFHLKAYPEAMRLKAGARERVRVVAEGAEGLELRLAEEAKGIDVKIEPLPRRADENAVGFAIVLAVAPDAAPGNRTLRFVATGSEGSVAETRVLVHVLPGERGEAAKPKPVEPRPHAPGKARPEAARPGFALRMEPEGLPARGGETLTFHLGAHAVRNVTVALSLAHVPEGYEARLEPMTLTLGPGARSHATLTVQVPANASDGTFVVQATPLEGEGTAYAKARVEIVRPRAPAPAPAPTPAPAERGDEERFPPAREARPRAEGPGFRMVLYPKDALVAPQGGRVLALFEGGAQDQVLKLDVRHPEDAGWRAWTREHVKLPAHGQAWAWVYLQPGAHKDHLAFDLVAHGQHGRAVASGTAQVEAPHTA